MTVFATGGYPTSDASEYVEDVAKDRVISTVGPEMRHDRKSSRKRFDGYKGRVSADAETELVTEAVVTPGNTNDGEAS